MLLKRLVFLLSLLCTAHFSLAQQPSAPSAPVTKDAQAVSILNQALVAAGGLSSIAAIQDVTETGTLTSSQPPSIQSAITARAKSLDQLRIDANLAPGISGEAISYGNMSLKQQSGTVIPVDSDAPAYPSRLILPYMFLSAALAGPNFSLSYKGVVELDGHSVNDVQVREFIPGQTDQSGLFDEYHTVDFFVDASTYQVSMMQDVVPRHLSRQTRYSQYGAVSGILVPFSISEEVEGVQDWVIQLDHISLNTGLQDSDFQL